MDTRKIEALLAEKYKYKNLPQEIADKYHQYFDDNIPDFLKQNTNQIQLYTNSGSLVCTHYNRIVIGDYGAFVEFTPQQANEQIFIVMPGQEFRINNPRYSAHVKYEWLTIDDKSKIKIYRQKRTVTYADYIVGMYYVSVHEVQGINE